ncbi:hypothetical protein HBI56_028300 [Parastagonospora nodorum]|uniref:Uncharacterized protein n=2 Tax=Phaeosphaeria nodorum (strain SN15 / ATCC MYA-4574 / FGSC 10173) TaxID=321614 RepID=A0A7U2EY59_PHANO|nr:hypothetical protein SNOG_02791 [Parastagonospora nodorum SN15]KAH3919561.1 hypothetical protein HBH56_015950 [Parastagonospora nodorum]EAT89522.1 hypothetical protein SNOG_02791 [Parastagonospora nodorum SN15]KAH3937457.1 hypothetical protein HBH54_018500 [Parastagonospora nodorum]KAH3953531.1 hypothetical protein HBH53_030890 [Parastagonospora nodorum]KAH3969469.1 hypothetical protein HBH51_123060 [Parastagonospora nodorum]
MLCGHLQFLRQFSEGIEPTNLEEVRRVGDLKLEELFYAELNSDKRLSFLKALWDENVFVSFLWGFQSVLHFKRCWDDPTIQDLYKDKFIYIADLIVQYILTPRNITQTCTVLSSNALIRATIEIPEDRTTAYAKFRAADETLWTDADGPGNEGILWVQESATPSTSVKTLKYYTTSQLRGTVNMTI